MGQGDRLSLTIWGKPPYPAVGIGSSQGSILIVAPARWNYRHVRRHHKQHLSSETKITVQNSAQVSITCSGPKGTSASPARWLPTARTVQAASSAYTALPTLTYTDPVIQVTAGTEAGSASKVDRDDLTASVSKTPMYRSPLSPPSCGTGNPGSEYALPHHRRHRSPSGLCSPGGCHRAACRGPPATRRLPWWTRPVWSLQVGPGTATITARAGEASAACTVTVSRPASSGPTRYPPIPDKAYTRCPSPSLPPGPNGATP